MNNDPVPSTVEIHNCFRIRADPALFQLHHLMIVIAVVSLLLIVVAMVYFIYIYIAGRKNVDWKMLNACEICWEACEHETE